MAVKKEDIKIDNKKELKEGNKLLFFLALLVVIMSLFVLGWNFVKMTGFASDTEFVYINITIDEVVRINFDQDTINFGAGKVDAYASKAIIDSTGYVVNGTWNATNQTFILSNVGNVNASFSLKAGKSPDSFIGGTSPSYQYNVTEYLNGSCAVTAGFSMGEWIDVNTTDPGTDICDILYADASKNSVRIDLRLGIPSDATLGNRSDTIVATARTAV